MAEKMQKKYVFCTYHELEPQCVPVPADSWNGGGEKGFCHQRRPGVPEAVPRSGEISKAELQQQRTSQSAGQHQTQRVSESLGFTVLTHFS